MIAALALVQACSLDGPELKPENPQSAPYKVQIYNEIDQQPATRVATASVQETRWAYIWSTMTVTLRAL